MVVGGESGVQCECALLCAGRGARARALLAVAPQSRADTRAAYDAGSAQGRHVYPAPQTALLQTHRSLRETQRVQGTALLPGKSPRMAATLSSPIRSRFVVGGSASQANFTFRASRRAGILSGSHGRCELIAGRAGPVELERARKPRGRARSRFGSDRREQARDRLPARPKRGSAAPSADSPTKRQAGPRPESECDDQAKLQLKKNDRAAGPGRRRGLRREAGKQLIRVAPSCAAPSREREATQARRTASRRD